MPSTSQKRGISFTVTVLVAIISVLCGLFFSNAWQAKKHRDFVNNFSGTLLDMPREISSFSLEGTNGLPFSQESLKGRWSLMFFGFSNCPVLCPTTMNTLGQFYKGLEKAHQKKLPLVVMVSLDPARDSMSRLKSYVTGFDSHFLGARADEAKVNKITKELGVVHMKEALKKNQKNYNIEHSGAVMIFNPQGQLAGFFTPPLKAEKLAEDYTQMVG